MSGLRCLGVVGIGLATALVFACGTRTESAFTTDAGTRSGSNDDASFGSNDQPGPPDEDLYAHDPPPPWCGPGGDPAPPQPGGTEECPDDKNKPGCGCTELGAKAKCWTGLRKQRGLGVCKDGEATCQKKNELNLAWGECVGEVLPSKGATKGAGACTCFSEGQWKIANTSPCFIGANCTSQDPKSCATLTAASTVLKDGNADCSTDLPPKGDWSTSTLKVDCAGHFKLCLRIRVGNFDAPNPATDCIVGEVCTEGDYKEAGVEQTWSNLPAWVGTDTACAKKWAQAPANASAGYAEMIVKGQSVRCDSIDDGSGNDLVFNRTKFCPMQCNDVANKDLPDCVICGQSGQGSF